jgi:hypothetical protein
MFCSCRSWVNRVTLTVGRPLPVYPDQPRHVGLVPEADSCSAAKRSVIRSHAEITATLKDASRIDGGSAHAGNASGMVKPNASAVLRLIASSNLVGCSTGMSAAKRVVFPEVLLAHKGLGRKMPPINSSTIAIPKRILRCRGSSSRSGSALQGSWSKYAYHLSR